MVELTPAYLNIYGQPLTVVDSLEKSLAVPTGIRRGTNIVTPPRGKDGRPDYHAVKEGHSVWVSIDQADHPLAGKHILVTRGKHGYTIAHGDSLEDARGDADTVTTRAQALAEHADEEKRKEKKEEEKRIKEDEAEGDIFGYLAGVRRRPDSAIDTPWPDEDDDGLEKAEMAPTSPTMPQDERNTETGLLIPDGPVEDFRLPSERAAEEAWWTSLGKAHDVSGETRVPAGSEHAGEWTKTKVADVAAEEPNWDTAKVGDWVAYLRPNRAEVGRGRIVSFTKGSKVKIRTAEGKEVTWPEHNIHVLPPEEGADTPNQEAPAKPKTEIVIPKLKPGLVFYVNHNSNDNHAGMYLRAVGLTKDGTVTFADAQHPDKAMLAMTAERWRERVTSRVYQYVTPEREEGLGFPEWPPKKPQEYSRVDRLGKLIKKGSYVLVFDARGNPRYGEDKYGRVTHVGKDDVEFTFLDSKKESALAFDQVAVVPKGETLDFKPGEYVQVVQVDPGGIQEATAGKVGVVMPQDGVVSDSQVKVQWVDDDGYDFLFKGSLKKLRRPRNAAVAAGIPVPTTMPPVSSARESEAERVMKSGPFVPLWEKGKTFAPFGPKKGHVNPIYRGFIQGSDGKKIEVAFKPNEELGFNAKETPQGEPLREGIPYGVDAGRERAAYVINRWLGDLVEAPEVVERDTPKGHAAVQRLIRDTDGAVAMMIRPYTTNDYGFEKIGWTPREVFDSESDGALYDEVISNLDRNSGNALVRQKRAPGKRPYVCIDHSLCLPEPWTKEYGNCANYFVDKITRNSDFGPWRDALKLRQDQEDKLTSFLAHKNEVNAELSETVPTSALDDMWARVRWIKAHKRLMSTSEQASKVWQK